MNDLHAARHTRAARLGRPRLRRGRAAAALGVAALVAVLGGLTSGCRSDITGSSGTSGGACAAHTVKIGETYYHEYGLLRGAHGRKVGTGDALTSCNDVLEGPSGSAALTTPSPETTSPVALYAIGSLDPAQAVAIETDLDGDVMLVPADGAPDCSLAKYIRRRRSTGDPTSPRG